MTKYNTTAEKPAFPDGLPGIIIYSLCTVLYMLYSDRYHGLVLLYIGNFLFAALIGMAVIRQGRKSVMVNSVLSLFRFGFRLTLLAIIGSLVILAVFFLVKGHSLSLLQSPVAMGENKKSNLALVVFLDATLVNVLLGLFISLMLAASFTKSRQRNPGK